MGWKTLLESSWWGASPLACCGWKPSSRLPAALLPGPCCCWAGQGPTSLQVSWFPCRPFRLSITNFTVDQPCSSVFSCILQFAAAQHSVIDGPSTGFRHQRLPVTARPALCRLRLVDRAILCASAAEAAALVAEQRRLPLPAVWAALEGAGVAAALAPACHNGA